MSEHVSAVPADAMMGTPTVVVPALILDPAHGATLVVTGLPGMADILGRRWLSWHWPGRVGAEVPCMQGEGQKQPAPEMLAALPSERHGPLIALFSDPPRAAVTRVLQGGEVMDSAGGVLVVATPGRPVGRLSLLGEGVLIAGDALTAQEGQPGGPLERATVNLPEALRSLQKLAALPVTTVLAYHGWVVREDTPPDSSPGWQRAPWPEREGRAV
ncbi:MBL fold metallo-hydrolase [Deinococcus hopiensis]|uniref:Metallo-beta-lactamase superfamily protein n=1 Tax=Deinococcus hopiensis KR-140 TaxID=695939 RepID=A0A1W1V7Q5_9DEIO|nr:MBL fold metallo-hydrolase [Deinococcus hopiensis]SMB89293.1 Metallo-beta-lactamase superfamily protein [Deinococcus hopiensis KR-140]